MTGLRLEPAVLLGADAELVSYPADEIWLRAVGHGEVQVADYRSEDREGPSAHSIRVPTGVARIIQVSIGAPYDGFAREMALLFGQRAPLEKVVEAAARHGVRLG